MASLRVDLKQLDCSAESGPGVLLLSHACCSPQPGSRDKLEEALSCCVSPESQPVLPPSFNASSCDDDVSLFFGTLARLHGKVAAEARTSRDLAEKERQRLALEKMRKEQEEENAAIQEYGLRIENLRSNASSCLGGGVLTGFFASNFSCSNSSVMALHMRGCLMAIATSAEGLAVVEEDERCTFCSVEEAVKVLACPELSNMTIVMKNSSAWVVRVQPWGFAAISAAFEKFGKAWTLHKRKLDGVAAELQNRLLDERREQAAAAAAAGSGGGDDDDADVGGSSNVIAFFPWLCNSA
jgi:hypothetical protein